MLTTCPTCHMNYDAFFTPAFIDPHRSPLAHINLHEELLYWARIMVGRKLLDALRQGT